MQAFLSEQQSDHESPTVITVDYVIFWNVCEFISNSIHDE